MPNLCGYAMKVTGRPTDVEEVIKTMKSDYNYNTMEFSHTKHLFRVFDAYINSDIITDEIREVELGGTCAWSVYSCMLEGEHTYYSDYKDRIDFRGTTLIQLSLNHNVKIEVYSEECGCCFQEHYLFENGETITEDCVPYYELSVEQLEEDGLTIEEYIKNLNEESSHNFTMEDVNNEDDEDYYYIGGMAWDWTK